MLLHQRDASLLMVDSHEPTAIFKMDLERGAVVEEWRTQTPSAHDGFYPVAHLNPASKTAQRTDSPLVLAQNETSVFTVDGRLQGPLQRVEQLTYTYGATTRAQLSAIASSAEGHVVCGSLDGSVRLFHRNALAAPRPDLLDRVPRAKSLFPGWGDPVTALDVTADARWVLATCGAYLLLLSTVPAGGSASAQTGFSRALGKGRADPIMLCPRPTDVAAMGGEVRFTAARFDLAGGGAAAERSIVTASGNFSFVWSFEQVVRHNRRDAYVMRRFDDQVTSSQFATGDDSKIVVALADDVQLARRVPKSTPKKLF